MTEPTTAPCGHPTSLFEHTDGTERPIVISAGGLPPAIWCVECPAWVDLPPADLATLVLTEQIDLPIDAGALAWVLAGAPGDEERATLFGKLQHTVGRGRINDVWYEACQLERVLLAKRERP